MIGLDQTGTVYTPNGSTGAFTVVAKSNLACRLTAVGVATVGNQRVEISGSRLLLWDPSYVMPDEAQVEVEGVRWNVKAGSQARPRLPGGVDVYRRCEVVEAVS